MAPLPFESSLFTIDVGGMLIPSFKGRELGVSSVFTREGGIGCAPLNVVWLEAVVKEVDTCAAPPRGGEVDRDKEASDRAAAAVCNAAGLGECE